MAKGKGGSGRDGDGKVIQLRQGQKRELTPAELEQAKAERDPARAPRNTPLCGARLKDGKGKLTGETCSQIRGWGTTHRGYGYCKRHGGSTKAGAAFAAKQRAEELVAAEKAQMRLFGRRSIVTPEDALLGELGRTHAIVQGIEAEMAEWTRERAQQAAYVDDPEYDADDVTRGITDNGVTAYGQTATGLPQLVAVHMTERSIGFTDTEWSAWIKVLREERKLLVQVANACIAAGIVERRQRMLEANADFMRRVLSRGMEALGVSVPAEQMAEVMQASIRAVVQELQPGIAG